MAQVFVFHHAHGLTEGIREFAAGLRAAGHGVELPDLYEGFTFPTVEAGVAHAERVGFDTIIERGMAAARDFPAGVAYIGFSLGAMPAQKLAQTKVVNGTHALAAILYHSGVPISAFGSAWPDGVPLQVHFNRHDKWEELESLEQLVQAAGADGHLFLYEGASHLFADSSLPDYEPESARLAMRRTLELLNRWPEI